MFSKSTRRLKRLFVVWVPVILRDSCAVARFPLQKSTTFPPSLIVQA